MSEKYLERFYYLPPYPRDSKTTTDKGFFKNDNGSMAGMHWVVFSTKDIESLYFDSCGRAPDTFVPNQLPEPITYLKHLFQDVNSRLRGS